MISEDRASFFARHNATPCRHCERRDEPGRGIGPFIAEMLFSAYASAEADRLSRLQANGCATDGYNEKLKEQNHQLFIRACWLANVDPDAAEAGQHIKGTSTPRILAIT